MDKLYLEHLDADERAALAHFRKVAKERRQEAAINATWAKQIVDRARARMKAKGDAK